MFLKSAHVLVKLSAHILCITENECLFKIEPASNDIFTIFITILNKILIKSIQVSILGSIIIVYFNVSGLITFMKIFFIICNLNNQRHIKCFLKLFRFIIFIKNPFLLTCKYCVKMKGSKCPKCIASVEGPNSKYYLLLIKAKTHLFQCIRKMVFLFHMRPRSDLSLYEKRKFLFLRRYELSFQLPFQLLM